MSRVNAPVKCCALSLVVTGDEDEGNADEMRCAMDAREGSPYCLYHERVAAGTITPGNRTLKVCGADDEVLFDALDCTKGPFAPWNHQPSGSWRRLPSVDDDGYYCRQPYNDKSQQFSDWMPTASSIRTTAGKDRVRE